MITSITDLAIYIGICFCHDARPCLYHTTNVTLSMAFIFNVCVPLGRYNNLQIADFVTLNLTNLSIIVQPPPR